MNRSEYVQYGCGWTAPPAWLNFDASPTLRFERMPLLGRLYTRNRQRFPANVEYGDIVRGLPVPAGSCRAIYCSHILEHLSLEDCRHALRNTHALLQPGGIFRLVLPDLESAIRKYLNNPVPNAAPEFIQHTGLGLERKKRGLHGLLVAWLGNSQHLWMWDYKSMEQELRAAGFHEVRRAQFGDSADPHFKDVEQHDRWNDCLGIECRQ